MIIASWNCNMAFRKKIASISLSRPDILVVQECEDPVHLQLHNTSFQVEDMLWFGTNKSKGIGIFSFTNFRFEVHEKYNEDFKYIIPISVRGPIDFTLFAVWAMDDKLNRQNRYIGQVWNALNDYNSELDNESILIGDFNSNAIWDSRKKHGNHSDVVRFLKKKKIESAYHHFYDEDHGQESRPTFYMHRKLHKPYHIDYCFLSEKLIHSLSNVTVGTYSNWIPASDHVPIVVELNLT